MDYSSTWTETALEDFGDGSIHPPLDKKDPNEVPHAAMGHAEEDNNDDDDDFMENLKNLMDDTPGAGDAAPLEWNSIDGDEASEEPDRPGVQVPRSTLERQSLDDEGGAIRSGNDPFSSVNVHEPYQDLKEAYDRPSDEFEANQRTSGEASDHTTSQGVMHDDSSSIAEVPNPALSTPSEIIELTDEHDGDLPKEADHGHRQEQEDEVIVEEQDDQRDRKRQRGASPLPSASAWASFAGRNAHRPDWMTRPAATKEKTSSSQSAASLIQRMYRPATVSSSWTTTSSSSSNPLQKPPPPLPGHLPNSAPATMFDRPVYFDFPPDFRPTWAQIIPQTKRAPRVDSQGPKYFQLSLLNVNEFTIAGLPPTFGSSPTSIAGLRAPIRQACRASREQNLKPVYERDKEGGGGKWRIPLAAYHNLVSILSADPKTQIEGIPPHQLNIAFLERARQEKGYPTAEKLMEEGVPQGLAQTLAPFQRGGVDFVLSRNGRALIADDMGLGKTIQAIASMSVYHKEWPLLVLTPSSARYHWESEFQHWLGVNSVINKTTEEFGASSKAGLLLDSQIHVLTSSKGAILPDENVKVVVCSYGLVASLVQTGKILPGLFRCAIVDESHMLKNKQTKRTSALVPILRFTTRCILLSGTPALARPVELWPQLEILQAERHNCWRDEAEFMDKYVKRGGTVERAELHAMLTGTVMIRRLKGEILKTLPKKNREKAHVDTLNHNQRLVFRGLLSQLRMSKGALGNIARSQHDEMKYSADADFAAGPSASAKARLGDNRVDDGSTIVEPGAQLRAARQALDAEIQQRWAEGRDRIQESLAKVALLYLPEARNELMLELEGNLRAEIEELARERNDQLNAQFQSASAPPQMPDEAEVSNGEEGKRTSLLSRLYALTGHVKIPLVVDMLKRWLADPTKGKLCIFAHHISVLDSISDLAGLSNEQGSTRKFIRIDGSTLPKARQQQIKAFQTDPAYRIALLGITAAGVAVTLTASSNVWFTELFWTPAIMIQAEDRCHRIGQQAQVNCLYFVQKGTLDDVLWKLVEKKFQDLGEFVEGKEKLKLVINKTYNSVEELNGIFEEVEDDLSDDGFVEDNDDIGADFQFDSDLFRDIEQLGEEERLMLKVADGDDDENDQGVDSEDVKVSKREEPQARSSVGGSEESAIALLDDEDDVKPAAVASSHQGDDFSDPSPLNPGEPEMEGCRLYYIFVGSQRMGIEVGEFKGRVIVSRVDPNRQERFGVGCKPSEGDVLVAINSTNLPIVPRMDSILQLLREALTRPPVQLTFVEVPFLMQMYEEHREKIRRLRAEQRKAAAKQAAPADPNEVIELD